MHYSLYNHIVQTDDGMYALYNFLTGRCLQLNYFSKQVYDDALTLGVEHGGVKNLLKYGFLVDFDEKEWLKRMSLGAMGRTDRLFLCICPTMACNFNCPYCFETPRSGRMTGETRDALIAFTERLIKDGNPKSLYVTWFGGEPMLEMGIIQDLSRRLVKLCEPGIKYGANIVTNGWFLTPENIRILESCHISEAQITLDGPCAEINDATRRPKGESGSFDRIISNLRGVKTAMRFGVRCNVLKQNEKMYPDLVRLINRIAEETGNIIHVAPARAETGLNPERDCSSAFTALSAEEFAGIAGISPKRLRFEGSYCVSQKLNSYCIDERGDLYKCWEAIGYGERAFGNIRDFALTKNPDGRIKSMLDFLGTVWPENDGECMACKVLPVCLGGCPNRRLTGGHRCEPYKYTMDEYVKHVYLEVYGKKDTL